MTTQQQPTLQDVLNAVNNQAQIINNQGQGLKAVQDAMQEMALWRRTAFNPSNTTGSGSAPSPQVQTVETTGAASSTQQLTQPPGEPDVAITFQFWGPLYSWNAKTRDKNIRLTEGHLNMAAQELAFYAQQFMQQRAKEEEKKRAQPQ